MITAWWRRSGARRIPIRSGLIALLPVLLFAGSTGLHELTHDLPGLDVGEPIYRTAEHAAAAAHLDAAELPEMRSCLLCIRYPKPYPSLAVARFEVRLPTSEITTLPAGYRETSAVSQPQIPRPPPVA
jgi:hypothetical protein